MAIDYGGGMVPDFTKIEVLPIHHPRIPFDPYYIPAPGTSAAIDMGLDLAGILADNQVFLGDTLFPVPDGLLRLTDASVFPAKVTIGTTTRSDQLLTDEWIIDNLQGGLLIQEMDEQVDVERFWWSTLQTWTRRKVFLAPLIWDIGRPEGETGKPTFMTEYKGNLLVWFGTKVYRIEDDGTWSAQLEETGTAKDACVYKGDLYVACGTEYWIYDEATWTQKTDDAEYFCLFDYKPSEKLMKIDAAGLVSASADGVTWSTTVKTQIEDRTITGLLVYRNQLDDPALFVVTTTGLIATDPFTQENMPTSLNLLEAPYNGKGTCVWSDGNLYFPAGLGFWRYPRSGQINNMGLDTEYGLPPLIRGKIIATATTPNFIVAAVDATSFGESAPETWSLAEEGFGAAVQSFVQPDKVGNSALFLFNGSAWHTLYFNPVQGAAIKDLHFTNSYGYERRLFWLDDTSVKYLVLPEGNYDPTQDPSALFRASGSVITGWFDDNYSEMEKLALSCTIRAEKITHYEYIDVYYATDHETESDPPHFLGRVDDTTIREDGTVTFPFDFPGGIVFRALRLKFEMHRGYDASLTPILLFSDLTFKRVPAPAFAFNFTVGTDDVGHCLNLWREMVRLVRSRKRLLFKYRNDQDETELHLVAVTGLTGVRPLNSTQGGQFTVNVVELEVLPIEGGVGAPEGGTILGIDGVEWPGDGGIL